MVKKADSEAHEIWHQTTQTLSTLSSTVSWLSMTMQDSHCHIVFFPLWQQLTKALMAWTKCLKEKYGVNPTFVHVNKDMVEIRMPRVVWNAKISLCWWHLWWAVSGDIPSCMYPFIYPIYHSYFTFILLAYIHLLLFGYHLNLSCSQ